MAIKVGGVTVIDDSRNLQNIANLHSGLSPTAIKTSGYTAIANDLVRCNSSAGAFSITLPATPSDGDMVGVIDVAGTFETYPVTLLPGSGKTVEGDATSLILNMNNTYVSFVYTSSTTNWRLMETPIGQLPPTKIGFSATTVKTSAYTANVNDLVRCDSSAGSFSVTMPTSPADGDAVSFLDVSNTFETNAVTLLPGSGKTIEGDATSLALNMNGTYVSFVYNTSTSNWRLLETPIGLLAPAKSGLLATSIKTSAYTAVANDLVRCNSTAGAFSVTMPASPSDGDMVGVIDVAGTFGTYAITVLPGSGKTIEGDSVSLSLDMNGTYVSFVYTSVTSNWRLMETPIGQLTPTKSGLSPTAVKTSAYTAVANDLVRADTILSAFTVTMPASPVDGDIIGIIDIAGTFGTYALTVSPGSGKTIEGDSASLVLDLNGTYVSFVYTSATTNWKLMETPLGLLPQLNDGSKGIFVNKDTISSNYTIASGSNGFSVGPITIATGATVTVASGQRWVVI